jgi:hypothetical protein
MSVSLKAILPIIYLMNKKNSLLATLLAVPMLYTAGCADIDDSLYVIEETFVDTGGYFEAEFTGNKQLGSEDYIIDILVTVNGFEFNHKGSYSATQNPTNIDTYISEPREFELIPYLHDNYGELFGDFSMKENRFIIGNELGDRREYPGLPSICTASEEIDLIEACEEEGKGCYILRKPGYINKDYELYEFAPVIPLIPIDEAHSLMEEFCESYDPMDF